MQIERLEKILAGETVDGLKLNDAGLTYDWVIQAIADRHAMLARM